MEGTKKLDLSELLEILELTNVNEIVKAVKSLKSENIFLNQRDDILTRLECYGVDNWSGYGDAMEDSEGLFEQL